MNVLVISPHPDDEAIGCGGAICRHIAEGDVVEVIFLTSGEKGGHGLDPHKTAILRETEANEAAKILGIKNIEFWRLADGAVQVSEENISRLKNKILQSDPAIIYAPHENEEHPDHKAAAAILLSAITNDPQSFPQAWLYEVWTPIEKLRHIVDISDFVDVKRKAIQAHHSQCSVLKFDEAILGLNRYRGEMHSWPGGDYAEAFTIFNNSIWQKAENK